MLQAQFPQKQDLAEGDESCDGAEKFCTSASIEAIAQNDFQLTPSLYIDSNCYLCVKSTPEDMEKLIRDLKARGIGNHLVACLNTWQSCLHASTWEKAPLSAMYESLVGICKKVSAEADAYPMVDTKTVIKYDFLPDELPVKAVVTEAEKAHFSVLAGDLLLNRTSESLHSLGQCCVSRSDSRAVYGCFLKRLRPRYSNALYPSYVCAYFQSAVYRKEIYDYTPRYMTRYCLNNRTMSQISLYFPDFQTQQRIGGILEAIFEETRHISDPDTVSVLNRLKSTLIELCITKPILKQTITESE